MDNGVIIKADNVSKKFCRSLKKSMMYGVIDIGKNMCGIGSHPERLRKDEFWALQDLSFEIKKGESLGLIGPNGSGKTTLLKILNGIFWPDKGKISMRGRMGALIAVGAGFHPLLTGRENIYVNGAILGMSKKEVCKKFDSIVEFADIGSFLDSPVKHYSSGMFVRLGFSVAVHCEPDILLVDEALAVGDMNFQAKCFDRMEELSKMGTTKIYVSHELNSVIRLCQKTMYLTKGKLTGYGDTVSIIDQYKRDVIRDMKENVSIEHQARYGTREIEIEKVEFQDRNNEEKNTFKRDEPLKIKIFFKAHKEIMKPRFVIKFFTENGRLIAAPSTRDPRVTVDSISGSGELDYLITELPFNIGHYSVSVAIWDFAGHLPYDVHDKLYDFVIIESKFENITQDKGDPVYIPAEWKWIGI